MTLPKPNKKKRVVEEPNLPFIGDFEKEVGKPLTIEDLDNLNFDALVSPRAVIQAKRKKAKSINPFLTGSNKFTYRVLRKRSEKRKVSEEKLPVNTKILQAAKASSPFFLKEMGANQLAIRNFLVKQVAPKMVPAMSAVDDSKDVLSEILGSKVDSNLYTILMKQLQYAAETKIASWIAKYFKLSTIETERFLERIDKEKDLAKFMSQLQKVRPVSRQEERSQVPMQRVSRNKG